MTYHDKNEWIRYEQIAQNILKQLKDYFNLDDVQGKQKLKGKSGTEWEIDAVATSDSSQRLVVIECRRTKARQSQEKLGAIAFKIQDTCAERGIIVTPHPLQKGAQAIANFTSITHFKLTTESCSNNFLAEALGNIFIGLPSIGDTSQLGVVGIKTIQL